MMEQQYWERFLSSGKVEDYLEYKGMEICERTISKYDGGARGESDQDVGRAYKTDEITGQVGEDGIESISYGDRYYHVGDTDWRI